MRLPDMSDLRNFVVNFVVNFVDKVDDKVDDEGKGDGLAPLFHTDEDWWLNGTLNLRPKCIFHLRVWKGQTNSVT